MYTRLFSRVPTLFNRVPYSNLPRLPLRYHSTSIPAGLPLVPRQPIHIRTMSKDDLPLLMSWAKREGWNPGKYEIEPFFAADPTGFHILELEGEPIASMAAVKHSMNFAFIGLCIAKPECRGQGHFKKLFNHALSTLQCIRTTCLNSVLDKEQYYGKFGFVYSHDTFRWRGPAALPPEDLVAAKGIVLKQKADFSRTRLKDYDAKIFTTPRDAFLDKWLDMPESFALAAVDGGRIQGYGVLSAAEEGYKIAPLFADNPAIAEQIYRALCFTVRNKGPVFMDTTEANPNSAAMIASLRFEKVFTTKFMYKGAPPSLTEASRVYGSTTMEIG